MERDLGRRPGYRAVHLSSQFVMAAMYGDPEYASQLIPSTWLPASRTDRSQKLLQGPSALSDARAPASRAGDRLSAVCCGLALAGEEVEQLADGGLLAGRLGQR
jgi:hypothetical protein